MGIEMRLRGGFCSLESEENYLVVLRNVLLVRFFIYEDRVLFVNLLE